MALTVSEQREQNWWGNATLTRGFLRHTSRGVITNSSDIPVLTWHWEQPNICGK